MAKGKGCVRWIGVSEGCRLRLERGSEHTGSPIETPSLASRHRIGLDIDALGQFHQSLRVPQSSQSQLRLERREVVSVLSLAHRHS